MIFSTFQQNITLSGNYGELGFFLQIQAKDYKGGNLCTRCTCEREVTSYCWHEIHFFSTSWIYKYQFSILRGKHIFFFKWSKRLHQNQCTAVLNHRWSDKSYFPPSKNQPLDTAQYKNISHQQSGQCNFSTSYKLIQISKTYQKQDVQNRILKLTFSSWAKMQNRPPV